MTCRHQRIQGRIAKKEAQLALLYIELDAAIENVGIESYSLDTGNGKQATKRRDPQKIQELIDTLERQIDSLYRKLKGTGLVNMNMTRR